MKALMAALLFTAIAFVMFSREIPHPGESLPDLIRSELRCAMHMH